MKRYFAKNILQKDLFFNKIISHTLFLSKQELYIEQTTFYKFLVMEKNHKNKKKLKEILQKNLDKKIFS